MVCSSMKIGCFGRMLVIESVRISETARSFTKVFELWTTPPLPCGNSESTEGLRRTRTRLRQRRRVLPRNSWLLGRHGDGGDLVSEAGGFPLELVNLQFSVFKFVDGRSSVDVLQEVWVVQCRQESTLVRGVHLFPLCE